VRITLDLDEELLTEAKRLTKAKSKKAVIEQALSELIRSRRIEQLRRMIGTDAIDLTPEDLRRMRGK
jgi:Arc/MetJ family transcription regulator